MLLKSLDTFWTFQLLLQVVMTFALFEQYEYILLDISAQNTAQLMHDSHLPNQT